MRGCDPGDPVTYPRGCGKGKGADARGGAEMRGCAPVRARVGTSDCSSNRVWKGLHARNQVMLLFSAAYFWCFDLRKPRDRQVAPGGIHQPLDEPPTSSF